MNSKIYLFGLSFVAAGLVACGDDVTKVYENETTGMEMLSAGKELPECKSDNQGALVYSYDSNAVFFCAKKGWKRFVEESEPSKSSEASSCTGKTVKDGIEISCGGEVIDTLRNGKNGESKEGSSCTGKTVKDGIEISCGGEVVGTLKNGESAKAESCSGKTVKDGIEISCGGEVVGTLKNGTSEATVAGCTASSDENGVVTLDCDGDKSVIYKAECNGNPYDPAKSFCLAGEVTSLKGKCGSEDIDLTKQFCDSRDNKAYNYTVIKFNGYEQIWMAEDLDFETSNSVTCTEEEENSGICSQMKGRLYTWWDGVFGKDDPASELDAKTNSHVSIKIDLVQGRCPAGWHVPNYDEAKILANFNGHLQLDGNPAVFGDAAMLKSKTDWETNSNATVGTDDFGFNAVATGLFDPSSTPQVYGQKQFFRMWTTGEDVDATENKYIKAVIMQMNSYGDDIKFNSEKKSSGAAIRCLKDYK